jgi:formimidoylglutamate deiminase
MAEIFATHALLPEGWQTNVRVEIAAGKIASVQPTNAARPTDICVQTLIPAMPNLHSHTFQRAMAGMTETRGEQADSFWTWRTLMYRFLDHLTPDDVEAIAAFAFMEMLEQGFGASAEFHYLHHAQNGTRYDNNAELSARIIAGAQQTGMGLSLLPVLYTYAGLDQKQLSGGQLRFGNNLDQYLKLHSETASLVAKNLPQDSNIGIAPHSFRAVSAHDLKALTKLFPNAPTHIHVAEQVKEVEEVLAATGMRPVEWLLNNNEVKQNWCLIHATQMTEAETLALTKSGAVAGLCPITEANLGDGIFNANKYGGAFGIGTDSNIRISVSGELSALEYSQRLREKQRNILQSGENIYSKALAGGAQALQRNCGAIEVGKFADLTALDTNSIQLAGLKPTQFIDGWIFATTQPVITDVWSAGRHCVKGGRHIAREVITATYRKTQARLKAVL